MAPGPAHYQQTSSEKKGGGGEGGGGQLQETRPSYTFASTTSRLYSPPAIVTVSLLTVLYVHSTFFIYCMQDIPPPGSYEVSDSYSMSQGLVFLRSLSPPLSSSYLLAPLDRAPSRVTKKAVRGAFLSSSSRSAPPRDIMLEEPDIMNPGPFLYIHTYTRTSIILTVGSYYGYCV